MPGLSLHPLLVDFTAADVATDRAHTAIKEITGGSPDDTLIARYEYDGQNRRIAKEVYSGGSLDHTLDMYYNENWQILEVRKDGNANPLKQYVWHTYYIDAPAIRYYDPDTDGSNIETQYFTHDANFNVTALTDNTGAVIERYDYTPYGQVTILDPDFSDDADNVSDYEQDVLFAGYQYDVESGLYHVRIRNYHPTLGRWDQREPLGYIDGMSLYALVRSNPLYWIDPNGLNARPVVTTVQIEGTPYTAYIEVAPSGSGNEFAEISVRKGGTEVDRYKLDSNGDWIRPPDHGGKPIKHLPPDSRGQKNINEFI